MSTMDSRPLLLGTRSSVLALAQAEIARQAILAHFPEASVELRTLRTLGDRDTRTPLSRLPAAGAFTKEIEGALLDGAIDLAVHSLKDLPVRVDARLELIALGPREDARDALISRKGLTLATLPPGARVGTSSPRRRAYVLWKRPDLRVEELRGNVDTRLGKLDAGEYDAIVLAMAGLRRLGADGRVVEIFDAQECVPAPGQGALVIEVRRDNARTAALARAVGDASVQAATDAERAVLAALGGGCHLAMGAWGEVQGDELHLTAAVSDPLGRSRLIARRTGPVADALPLGEALAAELLRQGAESVLAGEE